MENKPQILRSKEEQSGHKVNPSGPRQIPPPKNTPEPKVLVSVEEQQGVVTEGPKVLESNQVQKNEQAKAERVSPQVKE